MPTSTDCKCCRRWKNFGAVLHRLVLDGSVDDDCGRCALAHTANKEGDSADEDIENSILTSPVPIHCNKVTQRRTPIPIQLRLAVVRNSRRVDASADFLSDEARLLDTQILTYFPPLSDESETLSSTATVATISDFIQYVVEDLFIENRESQFLAHDPTKFATMLVGGSSQKRNISAITFHYGGKKNNTISGENEGSGKSVCMVTFSLMEVTEGFAAELSPSIDAYEMFRKLISQVTSGSKRLDLILKARVRISSSSSPPNTKETQSRKGPAQIKRKLRTDEDEEGVKRSKLKTEVIRTSKSLI